MHNALATLAQAPPPDNIARFIQFLDNNSLWVFLTLVVLAGIIGGVIKESIKSRAREQSRREIAAYIAEGSMTPEQGERLMRAGGHSTEA
jgi:hypothetical protein